jgi:hypothetical protein
MMGSSIAKADGSTYGGRFFSFRCEHSCMSPAGSPPPYASLVSIADRLLEDCEDDAECLALRLGELEPGIRNELIVSDLLNAWQVFFFFFRTDEDDLLQERLELEPASALRQGIKIQQTDFYELFFLVREAEPVIAVSDGEKVVAHFSGTNALEEGREFLGNPEYQ